MRALVEAALETGMRTGELLGLQWGGVEGMTIDTTKKNEPKITWSPRAELVLTQTKTDRDRRVPISTRLKAILEMRRFVIWSIDAPPHLATPSWSAVCHN